MPLLKNIGLIRTSGYDPHQHSARLSTLMGNLCGAILLALGPIIASAAALPQQSHNSIRQAAVDYIMTQQGNYPSPPIARAGRLDPRLRLPQCEQPLTAFIPTGGRNVGNVTIGVRCDGLNSWSLFVPVRVQVIAQVVVTSQPIARGKVISGSELQLQERDLATLPHGYFHEIDKVQGKIAKRSLAHGSVLNPRQVEAPKMVKRGEAVTILAQASGFEVRMRGKALGHGAQGDHVRVKNLSSNRIVEGIVVSAGVVKVHM